MTSEFESRRRKFVGWQPCGLYDRRGEAGVIYTGKVSINRETTLFQQYTELGRELKLFRGIYQPHSCLL